MKILVDSNGLYDEVEKLAKRKRKIDGIAVLHENEVVFLEMYNGYKESSLHPIFSCTKSIVSLLIGILIEKKMLESVNTPIHTLLSSNINSFNEAIETINLEHLLTMKAGFEWDELVNFNQNKGLWNSFLNSEFPLEFIINRPLEHNPGEVYNYNSGLSHLLSIIIDNKYDGGTIKFAQDSLFAPLGINEDDYKWDTDFNGVPYGGHGLHMNINGLLKIAKLLLNCGVHDGIQIVEKDWIRKSIIPYSLGVRGYKGYGYQWWIGNVENHDFFGAFGHGGQRIYIFNDLKVSVIFLGQVQPEFGIQEKIIKKYILNSIL